MSNQKETIHEVKSFLKDSSLDDSGFDDDLRGDPDQIEPTELYHHIGAPIPLPSRVMTCSSAVHTVHNLSFIKLPSEMRDMATSIEEKDETKLETIFNKPDKANISLDVTNKEEINGRVSCSTQIQTLSSMYPKQDPRLIYQKYKDQGNWELKTKGYASYLVNIEGLIKNTGLKAQYQRDIVSKANVNEVESDDIGLQFNSVFESGNLYAAYKISDNEYDLILQNDINSQGHTQWFFFSVLNAPKGQTIKFNIVNLMKPESLFSEGMKPVVFSTAECSLEQKGWVRSGSNISYTKNGMTREDEFTTPYFTLSFSYNFKHANDTVYFAHSFPYTYSDLRDYLTKVCSDPIAKTYVTRRTLCYTLSKNKCEYLTVTSPYNIQNIEKRLGIVITARQHPGESLSSYIMEGFIDFIISEHPEAQFLRNHCIFKIVPMLNPDGVIHGNYRISLSGRDLNRIWHRPDPILHSTVYHTKELIRRLKAKRNLVFFCDLHGHSRKKNAFFYGNAADNNPCSARLFPYIFSKVCKYASFEDCRFAVQKSKERTARVALWRELKIDNIFTLEASFYGYKSRGTVLQFTREDYKDLGTDLCKAVYIYIKQITVVTIPKSIDQEGVKSAYNQMESFVENKRRRSLSMTCNIEPGNNADPESKTRLMMKNQTSSIDCFKLMSELKSNKNLIDIGNKNDDSGSGTDNSDDDIPMKDLKKVLPFRNIPKRKKIRSLEPNKKKPLKIFKEERQSPMLKVYNSAEKPRPEIVLPMKAKPIRRVSQILREQFKEHLFLEESIKEEKEMVSQSSQTDECSFRLLEQDSPLVYKINKPLPYRPLNGIYEHKMFGTNDRSLRSKSPLPFFGEDQLLVVGEKAGFELYSGRDLNYKLKKNQISRSILAKLNSKVFERADGEKDQVEYLLKAQRSDPLAYNVSLQDKRPRNLVKEEKDGMKGLISMNPKQYSSCVKDNETKAYILASLDRVLPSPSPSLEYRKDLTSKIKEDIEKRHILSQKVIAARDINSGTPNVMAAQKLTQRLGASKDRLSGPLPQLLSSQIGKTISKEALAASLVSALNYQKKPAKVNEASEDSNFRAKVAKVTPPATNPLPSFRDLSKKVSRRRERIPQGLYDYPDTQISEQYNSSITKIQSKSPGKTKISRLDRLLANEFKSEIERKSVDLEILNCKKGRKSQSTMLKKL